MDPLTFLLVSWIAVCGAIFFIVQNVLPVFVPHGKPSDSDAAGTTQKSKDHQDLVEAQRKVEQAHSEAHPQSTISSWASSAIGMVKGVGKSQHGESCEWVNNLLTWLHRHIRRSPDVTNAWLRAMNDASNKLAMSLGCDVYFEEASVTDGHPERRDQDAPKLSGVRSEFGPREHLTLHTHLVYPRLNLRLVASQKLPDRLIVSNYDAVLRDLKGEAQVRMACVQNDLYLMVCFDGKPDVAITLDNSDKNAIERVDPTLVDEIIKRCLATAVTNICLGKPQQVNGHVSGKETNDLMSASEIRVNQATSMQERMRSRRLLLKVQRAEKLGGGDVPSQPYVVVELDEPAQRHETTLSLNAHPIWEEQFLFDLNDRSEEILFEVYDRKTDFNGKVLEPRFLGLAIVGIEELRQSSNLAHTLALQSRPYKNDSVSGTLEVEFVFLREARWNSRRLQDETGPMVKSVSQYVDGGPADHHQQRDHEQSSKNKNHALPQSTDTVVNSATHNQSQAPPTPSTERSRKRERSFFATLKRRLSFGKSREKRAQSLEADIDGRRGQVTNDTQEPRSVSTPPSRDASRSRRPDHTPLASDSEMSVTSNDSVFPQSQLVVEVDDIDVKKYYLIPTPVQRHAIGKKIIKSGKKLHIFNSHTFTAIKSPPGSTCAVCKRLIATGFRRKGYQCRDCGFICHKRCHFKTESHCPSDKISNLPIEVVKLS